MIRDYLFLSLVSLLLIFGVNGCVHKVSCQEYDFDLGRKIVFERVVKCINSYGYISNYDDRVEIILESSRLFRSNTANFKSKADKIFEDIVEFSKHYSRTLTIVHACAVSNVLEQGMIEARVREVGKKLKLMGLKDYVVITGTEDGFCTNIASKRIKIVLKKRDQVETCAGGEDYCYTGQKKLICR